MAGPSTSRFDATHWQFLRYGITGVVSNALLFLAYVLLTSLGVGPKTAMTLLYVVGIVQTFLVNRRWTFRHGGMVGGPMLRYFLAYGLGYLVNLACLMIFVDALQLPHLAVQASMVLPIAVMIFLLQKYWVFPTERSPQYADPNA